MTGILLFKTLVKPFYRQNAGLFAFLFLMMFLAVGRANEAGLLEYHYSLIKGMLHDSIFLLLVFLGWLLFVRKYVQFCTQTLSKPESSFLYLLAQQNGLWVYFLLLQVQCLLYLPVLSYVVVILAVGYHQHWYGQTNVVLGFNVFICFASTFWLLFLIRNPQRSIFKIPWKLSLPIPRGLYAGILIKYVLTTRKLLYLIIKIYSCTLLYVIFRNRVPADTDLRMDILAYSSALLGHGILIHALKQTEDAHLGFYRGLPRSLLQRFMQYALFYFLLFVPEIITICWQLPGFMSYATGFFFAFLGYGVLLLLNSILLLRWRRMIDYLKIITVIFMFIFIGVLSGTMPWISVLIFVLSVWIFFSMYYQYEP